MKKRSYFLFVLPFLHLCLCLATMVLLRNAEGSWMWFPMFIVDFPFSILLLFIGRICPYPLLVFGIGGTLWWYFVGVAVAFLFKKIAVLLHD
jgi:hypothetical protein